MILTASSKSSEPINVAAEISRLKGRIVVVGLVGMTIDREPFYKRELELKSSMSYGPGRGDPSYEQGGKTIPCLTCAGPSNAIWRRFSRSSPTER